MKLSLGFVCVNHCRHGFLDGAGLLCIRRVVNMKITFRVIHWHQNCGRDRHLKNIWPFRVSF